MSSVNIFKKYSIEFIGLISLICLVIIITLIGFEVIPLNFPVESALIIDAKCFRCNDKWNF